MAIAGWDPARKSAEIILSGANNEIAQVFNNGICRAAHDRIIGTDTGKVWFELKIVVGRGGDPFEERFLMGVTGSTNYEQNIRNDGSLMWLTQNDWTTFCNTGQVYGFGIDLDDPTHLLFHLDGAPYSDATFAAIPNGTVISPGCGAGDQYAADNAFNFTVELRISQADFEYTPPAGYAPWETEQEYKVHGNVTVDGSPAARIVTAIKPNGTLIGQATADAGTGDYSFQSTYGGAAIVTCTDDYGNPWTPSTAVAMDELRFPTTPNGHYYKAQAGGTTGGTEPVWPTDGGSVADGGVTWDDQGTMRTPEIISPYTPIAV